jgi:hypothetical protein
VRKKWKTIVGIRLKSAINGMLCNNTTQNVKMGAPWEMDRKRLRISHVALTHSHGRDKRDTEPIKTSTWVPKLKIRL